MSLNEMSKSFDMHFLKKNKHTIDAQVGWCLCLPSASSKTQPPNHLSMILLP